MMIDDDDDIITLEAAIAQYDLEVELNEVNLPRNELWPSMFKIPLNLFKLTLDKKEQK